jgi:putative SOS response-associated peptidase YedK
VVINFCSCTSTVPLAASVRVVCGRFVSASPPDQVAAYFGAAEPETLLEPSHNVAPTRDVYAVLDDGEVRRMDAFHWGLVPFWADDPKIGSRMINARAEGLAGKGAFKGAFEKRRCIIPADGFYEWRAVPGEKRKQPYFVHHPDGEPYALAGLWEVWRGPGRDQEPLRSCTIITGPPNEAMARIHDRMPVILPPSAWDTWLDRANHDLDLLGKLLVPAPPQVTVLRPVSTAVNNVRNDGPDLTEEGGEGEPAEHQPELFEPG